MLEVICLNCNKKIQTTWLGKILNPACQDVTCMYCGSRHELKHHYILDFINGLFLAAPMMLLTWAGVPEKYNLLKFICALFISVAIRPFLILGLGRWRIAPHKYVDRPIMGKLTLVSFIATFIFAVAVAYSCFWTVILYRDVIVRADDLDQMLSSMDKFQHELRTKVLFALITAMVSFLIAKVSIYIRSKKIAKAIKYR